MERLLDIEDAVDVAWDRASWLLRVGSDVPFHGSIVGSRCSLPRRIDVHRARIVLPPVDVDAHAGVVADGASERELERPICHDRLCKLVGRFTVLREHEPYVLALV